MDLFSRVLFPAPKSSYSAETFPKEMIWVPNGMHSIPCLFLPYASARFLIFYLHSNAEDLGKCYSFCSVLREQFQVHVLAMEYPGYGICPGAPCTEEKVTASAFAVFSFILNHIKWPMDSIKIFGRSVGTGPAVHLATKYAVSGLILVAPFLSIREIIQDHFGVVLSQLISERFPNSKRAPQIQSPVLIIHGQRDAMIPPRHSIQLDKLINTRKLLVMPPNMEHNTNLLRDVGTFVLPMLQFFTIPDYCFDEICVPPWAYANQDSARAFRVIPRPMPPALITKTSGAIQIPCGDAQPLPEEVDYC